MMIEGIYDGSAAIHFCGPVGPERSSAMMSMAPRSAEARRRRGPARCGAHDGARLRRGNGYFLGPGGRVDFS
jgi:hypothetical protein